MKRVVASLENAGVDCFFDRESILPLEDFPRRICEAIDRSHAVLVWWSLDYADSAICLDELRRGWQHARRHSSDVGRRIWIVNPEPAGSHIFAGEVESQNYLTSPGVGSEAAWARDLLVRLEALVLEGPLSDERSAVPPPGHYGVPVRPPAFTGRGASLMRIHSKLHPVQIGAVGGSVALQLVGMGGVGKTTLAAAYADDFAAAYPGGVFWLNFAGYDPSRPVREETGQAAWLRALGSALALHPDVLKQVTREDELPLPPAAVRERLGRMLGEDRPYLWILDNIPVLSPLDVQSRILDFVRAPTRSGRTLMTTRDARRAAGFVTEPLDVLDDLDCVRLLTKFRPAFDETERTAMAQLVREIGGHTQALVLLGEQVRDSPLGYRRALDRMKSRGSLERIEEVARQLAPELGHKAVGVVATLAESIEPLDSETAELLALAAACVPNRAVMDRLLLAAFGEDREDTFSRALGTLLRASLVSRRDKEVHATFIHPLVSAAALKLLSADPVAVKEQLLIALNRCSVTLLEYDWNEACSYAEEAVAMAIALHGVDSDDFATMLENLALIIRQTCQSPHELEEIVALQEMTILIRSRVLGKEHPRTELSQRARDFTGAMAPVIAISYAGIGPGSIGLEEFDRVPGLEAPVSLRPLFPDTRRQELWTHLGAAIDSSVYSDEVERLFGPAALPVDRDFVGHLMGKAGSA